MECGPVSLRVHLRLKKTCEAPGTKSSSTAASCLSFAFVFQSQFKARVLAALAVMMVVRVGYAREPKPLTCGRQRENCKKNRKRDG